MTVCAGMLSHTPWFISSELMVIGKSIYTSTTARAVAPRDLVLNHFSTIRSMICKCSMRFLNLVNQLIWRRQGSLSVPIISASLLALEEVAGVLAGQHCGTAGAIRCNAPIAHAHSNECVATRL